MATIFTFKLYIRNYVLISLGVFISLFAPAQRVENRGCPVSYTRNNGNGQMITVFAPNITPGSVYAQTALNSGNQGAFTFKWNGTVINPPVINRTWITNTSNVSALNWSFGNNTTGSPFNPPAIPNAGNVKYNFFISNLPTAGVVTFEFMDPYDGSYVNTCSYPLSSGASSTGALASIAVASPTDFSYPVSTASTLYGTSGSSVEPTINAAGGTITYSLETTVAGVSINSATGVISWDATVAAGDYTLTVKASNGIAPDAFTTYNLTVTNDGVSSGNEGGLESKSIGNAIAERVFNQVITNAPSTINYKSKPAFKSITQQRITAVSVQSFIPDEQVLGANFKGFITSPTDILSFTNAKDVISVDYLQNGINKAVAFCTKTYNNVYTHTKPVCDRLKGAELISVDTIRSNSYSFIRYYLKPASGVTEYAVSFSAGTNAGANQYVLQSEWITDQFVSQDTMYNFQLWSADAVLLNKMLQNVLFKLNTDKPLQQTGAVNMPKTYISKADRNQQNQHNLQLTIKNNTVNTAGTIIISGKANEQSNNIITRSFPVTLNAFGTSVAEIVINDIAEAEMRLMVNGINEDFVYNNDGTWNIYKTPNTTVSTFKISNDTLTPGNNEFRLFRNVELKATSSDYVTIYRTIKGGGAVTNLNKYKNIRFTASGNGTVTIRLIKKSITNYSSQYAYTVQLSGNEKDYLVKLTDFRSDVSAAAINLSDVLLVSFTYETKAVPTQIETTLKNVRFSSMTLTTESGAQKIKAYPNPLTTNTTVEFNSATNDNLILQFTNAATGQVVYQQTVKANKGLNAILVNIPSTIVTGYYIIKLKSATQMFNIGVIKK